MFRFHFLVVFLYLLITVIFRSNLVGMGILPLQYAQGENATSLELTGLEQFTVILVEGLRPRAKAVVQASSFFVRIQT